MSLDENLMVSLLPPKTLARILASITIHNWTESCADPCCGTGTIPHEIIDLKRNKIGISKAIDTTWASDKYSLPLQIANVSMTSYDTINMREQNPSAYYQKELKNSGMEEKTFGFAEDDASRILEAREWLLHK